MCSLGGSSSFGLGWAKYLRKKEGFEIVDALRFHPLALGRGKVDGVGNRAEEVIGALCVKRYKRQTSGRIFIARLWCRSTLLIYLTFLSSFESIRCSRLSSCFSKPGSILRYLTKLKILLLYPFVSGEVGDRGGFIENLI
jgi:hypothetical protein